MFAVMAEFERELIRERTKAGMAAAKRAGPPVVLTPEKRDLARRLVVENKDKATIARMLGVSPATLRRWLNSSSPLPK